MQIYFQWYFDYREEEKSVIPAKRIVCHDCSLWFDFIEFCEGIADTSLDKSGFF